jgi:alpha-glucosidase
MLLVLRGVAVLYMGEEIGMVDAPTAILPEPPFDRAGRDAMRTPMQWNASPGGGFSTDTPWLPLVDHATRNVADQLDDSASLLSLYRQLIAVRRTSEALRRGTHRSFFDVAPEVLCWLREADAERVLVLLNTGTGAHRCDLARVGSQGGEVLVATSQRRGRVALDGLVLEPLEGIAVQLD